MKFSCSYTNLAGLTVSLGVSASQFLFEPCPKTSEETSIDHGLVSSAFEQSIPQLSMTLVKAHAEVELALQESFVSILQKKINSTEEAA